MPETPTPPETPLPRAPGMPGAGAGAGTPEPEATRPQGFRPLWGLAAFAVYTMAAVVLFRGAWAHPSTRLIGGCCDSAPTVDLLTWPGYALLHGHDPLISYWLNGYQGVNLMWQVAAVPALGFVATPFEHLLGPLVTYNLLATLALPLSGVSCYAALRRWVGGVAGPFLGGLLYAFSPFMASHSLGHLNLTMAFLPPLVLLVLFDLLVERRWSWRWSGATLGVLLAVQLLVGEELLATTLLTAGIAIVAMAATSPRAFRTWRAAVRARKENGPSTAVKGAAIAAAVFAVLAGIPLAVQYLGPGVLHGLLRPQNIFLIDPTNLFLPAPGVAQFVPDAGAYGQQWSWIVSETTGYLGFPLLALIAAVAIGRWRARPTARIATLSAASILVCSFGPSLHVAGVDVHVPLPWRLVENLPVLENVLPDRLTLLVYLAVAVLVAEAMRTVCSVRRLPTRLAGMALVAVALLPLVPAARYPTWTGPNPPFFRSAADVRLLPAGGMVFVAPFPRDMPEDVAPMLWQAEAGMRFRMEGGYVLLPGHGPRGTDLADPTGAPVDALNTRLDALAEGLPVGRLGTTQVTELRRLLFHRYRPVAVLVGPMPQRNKAVALFTVLLGRPPRIIGGVDLWLHV